MKARADVGGNVKAPVGRAELAPSLLRPPDLVANLRETSARWRASGSMEKIAQLARCERTAAPSGI